MTMAELKQYRNICREIEEIDTELNAATAYETVTGSGSEFPYIKHAITVGGVIPGDENAVRLAKLSRLQKRRDEIEDYVAGIDDGMTRRIFEQKYILGEAAPTWNAVAFAAGGGNSADGCRMTVKRYIEKN